MHHLIALLPLAALAAMIQDPTPPTLAAEDVLQLARTRTVGSENHCANSGVLHIKGTMQVQAMPMKGTMDELHHPAGPSRMTWTFAGFGDTIEGSDGRVHYEVSPMGVDVRKGWRAAAAYRILALRRYVPWTVMYSDAALDGFETVRDERCWRVKLTPKSPEALGFAADAPEPDAEGAPVEPPAPDVWIIGTTSYLLQRVDMQVSVPGRGAGTLALGFADWRAVNGVLVPFRTSRSMHGYTMESIAETVEFGYDVADDAFALPEAVQKQLGAQPAEGALPDAGWAISEVPSLHTATVRVKCKPEEISRTLASVLPEVMRYLGEVGADMTGPPFTRYHAMGADEVDLEAGIPVLAAIAPSGRIKASTLPSGRVVGGFHIGEYHRLGETHASLAAWLAAHGERAAGGPWEVYWTDPGMEPDPRKWRTQVVQPLAAK